MAKSFLTDINLNNNVLSNAKIQAWGVAPAGTTNPNGSGNAVIGQISSYLGDLYIFNNSNTWVKVGGGKVTIGDVDVNVNGTAVTTFTGLSSVTSAAFVGPLTGNVTGTVTGLTVASNKTLTVSNTLTLSGTDSSSLNIGTGGILASGAFANISLYATTANPTFTGTVSGITAAMVGLGNVTNESKTNMFSSPTFSGTVAAFTSAGIDMGNNKITNVGTPTLAGDAATKGYVDNVSTGVNIHDAVVAATTATIAGVYLPGGGTASSVSGSTASSTLTVTNTGFNITVGQIVAGNAAIPTGSRVVSRSAASGSGITVTIDKNLTAGMSSATGVTFLGEDGGTGVGATITYSATGVVTLDTSVTLALGNRVLVKDGVTATPTTSSIANGIYVVTTAGAVGTAAVLTRATDADNSHFGDLSAGDLAYVIGGQTHGGDQFVQTVKGTATQGTGADTTFSIKIGTDAISYTQFSGAGAVPLATDDVVGIAKFPNTQFTVTSGSVAINNLGTLAGTFSTSGAHTLELTTTGNTNVTLPTSGTLLSIPASVSSTPGNSLALTAGATTSTTLGSSGGALTITGGSALGGGNESAGGLITIRGGTGSGSGGFGGSVVIGGGAGPTLGGVYIGRELNGTALAAGVNIGASTISTNIAGTVVVPGLNVAGFVKNAANGTLSTGTIAYGDLPTSSLAAAKTEGIARKKTGTGTGTSSGSFSVNHQFGQWVTAQLFITSTGESVEVDVTNSATNTGTTTFASSSATTNWTLYTYVIIG